MKSSPGRQTDWKVERDFLTDAELAALIDDLNVLETNLDREPPLHVYRDDVASGSKRIVRIEKFIEHTRFLFDSDLFARIQRLAGNWLGGDACLFKDKINYRWPGSPGFGAHQDISAGWLNYISGCVSIGLFPNGSTSSTGGLVCANVDSSIGLLDCVNGQVPRERFQEMDIESVELSPRDLVLLGGYAPHCSRVNATENRHEHLFLTFSCRDEGDKREQYYRDKIVTFSRSSKDGAMAFRLFSYEEAKKDE